MSQELLIMVFIIMDSNKSKVLSGGNNLLYIIWIIVSAFILGLSIEKNKLCFSLASGLSLFISLLIGLFKLVASITF